MRHLRVLDLKKERTELQKDLLAFRQAYDTIRKRLLESMEYDPARAEAMNTWSGTWACVGSLDLASQSIERKLTEIAEMLRNDQDEL
jgi:hypothetical protein